MPSECGCRFAVSESSRDKAPDVDWLTHKPETFDVDHTDAVFFIDPAGQERITNEGMPEVAAA
jgi:hypothetical protein